MTHRQLLTALSGLLTAVFLAGLSSTIVATALPRIVTGLGGTAGLYTWVVTATLLAATASGPIWGKLADRVDRIRLVQAAIGLLGLGMLLAGFAPTVPALIAVRVVEGVGAGGTVSLAQTVLASLLPPREQGRYMAYFTAAGAAASIAAPPLGGLLVTATPAGWRGCFWAGVPVAAAALLLVRRTLRVPYEPRPRRAVDWGGALLIPAGIGVLLCWLSITPSAFDWLSWPSAGMVGLSAALCAAAVRVERRAADPVVPPRLLRHRTIVLALVAWVALGVPMVGCPVFFAEYFQAARGYSPVSSGLLTVPMVVAVVGATALGGRILARTGRYRPLLLGGTATTVAGLALLGTLDGSTPLAVLGVGMLLVGLGTGAGGQSVVVVAQSALPRRDLGAGVATLTFVHLLGGAAGLSILGSLYAALTATHPTAPRHASATATVFLAMALVSAAALVAAALIRAAPLTGRLRTAGTDRPASPARHATARAVSSPPPRPYRPGTGGRPPRPGAGSS